MTIITALKTNKPFSRPGYFFRMRVIEGKIYMEKDGNLILITLDKEDLLATDWVVLK